METGAALETVNEFLLEFGTGRAVFMKCDVTNDQDIQGKAHKKSSV